MTDFIHLIVDSINSHHTGILSMTSDTLVHKVYNVQTPTVFKWSDWLKPSIDALIAITGAIILILSYLLQKRKESKERIIESKRNAYSGFLNDFTETAVQIMHDKEASGIKHDRERLHARNQLLLYANDKVITAYHNWIEFADIDDHDIDEEVELFGKILIEIRKDLHGNSKVTEQEISNLNPFNRG